jgi:hypothetical protein
MPSMKIRDTPSSFSQRRIHVVFSGLLTKSEGTASVLPSAEQVVVQNTSLGDLPLIQRERDENDNADNQCCEYGCACPCKDTSAKIESGQ